MYRGEKKKKGSASMGVGLLQAQKNRKAIPSQRDATLMTVECERSLGRWEDMSETKWVGGSDMKLKHASEGQRGGSQGGRRRRNISLYSVHLLTCRFSELWCLLSLPITCDVHLLGAYGDADAHANHSGTSPASSSYKSFPGRLKHTELNLVVYTVSP